MAERTVAPAERAAYLASLAAHRAACAEAEVQFWAFEHATTPGRFVEFREARNDRALESVPLPPDGSVWRAVEVH